MDKSVSQSERTRQVNKSRSRRESYLVSGGYFDYQSVFLIMVLLLFGIVMVYSASSYRARIEGLASTYYVKKQCIAAIGGIVIMMAVSHINYRKLASISKVLLLISTALVLYVKFKGVSTNGSARWLDLGFVQFQPSEVAKIALIIYISHVCVVESKNLVRMGDLFRILALPMICIVLIGLENLSTAIICFVIVGVTLFVATPNVRNLIILGIVGVVLVYIAVTTVGYRGDRFEVWRDPEGSEKGFQTMQSLYAIGSGGLFGRGLGNSIQKMGFLPESHNDMIFSVVCEELGMVGALGVIFLFIMLLMNFRRIANNSADSFGGFLITGIITHIAVQTLVNIAVVTNAIPNTGVTLPFISYGGTSLLILLAEMGIVLSVSRQSRPLDSR